MASCERCWNLAQMRGVTYDEQLREASQNKEPCVAQTEEGARLRAGQFWDEATRSDKRFPRPPSSPTSAEVPQ